jgi:hypothetical protein
LRATDQFSPLLGALKGQTSVACGAESFLHGLESFDNFSYSYLFLSYEKFESNGLVDCHNVGADLQHSLRPLVT